LRPNLRFWIPLWVACFYCAQTSLYGQAPAPTAPFTMQQAVDYALAHNPNLLSAQQNLFSMKGQEVEAGLRQNPNFTVYGSDLSNPATSTTPYAYSLQLARLFERGQKRRWRLDSARATTAQTEGQFHDQQRGTALAVKQAFTTVLLAKGALKVAQDELQNYHQQLDIFRVRYNDGDLGKIDFERLDLQLAQFESDEATAQMNLVQTSDQLQTLMGFEQPRRDFDIVGDLVPPPVTGGLVTLEQTALANRPDYKAA
jgi:outer membrane protein, heavy metal efflux system